jgi:hypothetical protein
MRRGAAAGLALFCAVSLPGSNGAAWPSESHNCVHDHSVRKRMPDPVRLTARERSAHRMAQHRQGAVRQPIRIKSVHIAADNECLQVGMRVSRTSSTVGGLYLYFYFYFF